MSNEVGGRALQDPRRSSDDARRASPAPVLARRDPAGAERAARRDEPRRPAAAARARLPPARGLAPQALPRAPGNDRPLADLRPLEPQLRRPRSARLLLPRELVRLARHHHPRQDGSRGAARAEVRIKAPKIVAVASAVDLDFRYGCTPAWWQLWKGLHDGRRRPDRHAVPRQGDRVPVVAHRAEPALPRGRGVRAGA